MGRLRWVPPIEPKNGSAEREHPAVGGHRPVAHTGRAGHRSPALPGLSRVGIDHQRRLVHRLEGARRHLLQLVDQRQGPPGVRGAPEVPIRPVVGHDQPVVLHGPQDHLGLWGVGGDVEAGLEPEPGPHGWKVGVAGAAGLVPGRPEERRIGGLGRDADGVGDRAGQHFVVAQQSGKYGQSGGVGRGPAGRSEGVRLEVPDRPGVGGGRRAGRPGVVEFVERAGGRVDHEGVAVTGGLGPTLDGGVGPERIGSRVALRSVEEGRGHQGVGRRDHGIGHAVGIGRVPGRPEVGMEVGGGAVHAGQPGRAVGIDGQPRDVGVPHVVGREDRTAGCTGQRAAGGGRTSRSEQGQAGADHGQHDRRRHPCLHRSTHVTCPDPPYPGPLRLRHPLPSVAPLRPGPGCRPPAARECRRARPSPHEQPVRRRQPPPRNDDRRRCRTRPPSGPDPSPRT